MKKIIIWIIGIILLANIALANQAYLEGNLMQELIFTTDYNDYSSNSNNATNIGTEIISGGILGNAANFTKANSDIIDTNLKVSSPVSWDGWVYMYSSAVHEGFISDVNNNGNKDGISMGVGAAPSKYANYIYKNNADTNDNGDNARINSWQHFTITYDGTNAKYYMNGTLLTTHAVSGVTGEDNITLGAWYGADNPAIYFGGMIDEVKIFNVTLNQGNITWLHNNIRVTQEPSIIITINTPVNNTNITTELSVNVTADSNEGSNGNCQLYINDSLNATANFIDEQPIVINTTGISIGDYEYFIECNTTTISSTNSSTYNFYVDSNMPVCNFTNVSTIEDSTLEVTFSCTDEHFYLLNVSCDNNNYDYYIDGLDVTNFLYNMTINNTGDDECSYTACDGHTNIELLKEWYMQKNETKEVVYVNTKKAFEMWVDGGEIEFIRQKNKYQFNLTFYDMTKKYQILYYKASPNSNYLESEMYKGWVIDNAIKSWFDMCNKLNAPVFTINRGNGLFEYHIYTKEKVITFSSFGELNCISGTFTIKTESAGGALKEFALKELTFSQTMFLLVIFFIGLVILVYSEMIKNYIMLFLAGAYYLMYGLFLMSISPTFAIIVLVVAILIMVRSLEIRMYMRSQ